VESGKAELQSAFLARGLKPLPVVTEIVPGRPPGSFAVEAGPPARITGGDERGLMYGLLEAAGEIRTRGRLSPSSGTPHTAMRGIRYFIHNHDLDEDWYYSRDYWDQYFRMLAYDRFNRFNLVFGHQTDYLVPIYPYWVEVPEFPGVQVPGQTAAQRDRNLQMLQYISQAAAEHGVDFTLGIWEQNVWPSQKASVQGITAKNVGPYTYAALKKVLQVCPAIRSVQIRTNSESGIPGKDQVHFYGDYFYPALRDCGRRVTLDLRGWILASGMSGAVEKSGLPVRMSSKYWGEFLGRPYPPAETWPGYSYLNMLEKPRAYDFYWELWGLGSHRLLLWGNPGYVRRAVSGFGLGGAVGFEIDPPLAQKGYGNRPGKWGIFTASQQQRVFWQWEFERYWLFYLLWGRLSYDPQTPANVWQEELQKRFGGAAGEVLEAYQQSSRVINEIVAAHLADPNMYLWPEVNPGGLIDDYIDVRPSDWCYIASIPEAVENRLQGVASAKQTPRQTAALLDAIAASTEHAVARAREQIGSGNKEWASSEPDFEVLAMLARYHARKMLAADQLEYFYKTADGEALASAQSELEKALAIWQKLADLTDGLYPEQMVFGPDDVGHWKDRLPYVRHDLEVIKERTDIFQRFGRFDYGFDFGAPVGEPPAAGPSYRSTSYVRENTVEPRFALVLPGTDYEEATGYGWIDRGPRQAEGIPLTPYGEIRSAVKDPKNLPHDVLFRDYIRGEGAQRFRVKVKPGEYEVIFLYPDHTSTTAHLATEGDSLVIPFPQGSWSVSGLVIRGTRAAPAPAPAREPIFLPRPTFSHPAPKVTPANQPLTLTLRLSAAGDVSAVRLYYRPVNQLLQFKMLEAAPAQEVTFTIPGADISIKWDLMYYFEILNKAKGGWFEPDPAVTTPYYVVTVAP
jgi:hypothetical protein